MDKAGQLASVLCLHRHHKAAVSLGDEGFLQHAAVGGAGAQPAEHLIGRGIGQIVGSAGVGGHLAQGIVARRHGLCLQRLQRRRGRDHALWRDR